MVLQAALPRERRFALITLEFLLIQVDGFEVELEAVLGSQKLPADLFSLPMFFKFLSFS